MEGNAHVENALRAAGSATNLKGDESGATENVPRGVDEVSDENADGANEVIAEPGRGRVDLDHDGGVVGKQEVVVNLEGKLVVPGGVGMALRVHAGAQLALQSGFKPHNGVCSHRFGDGC